MRKYLRDGNLSLVYPSDNPFSLCLADTKRAAYVLLHIQIIVLYFTPQCFSVLIMAILKHLHWHSAAHSFKVSDRVPYKVVSLNS